MPDTEDALDLIARRLALGTTDVDLFSTATQPDLRADAEGPGGSGCAVPAAACAVAVALGAALALYGRYAGAW